MNISDRCLDRAACPAPQRIDLAAHAAINLHSITRLSPCTALRNEVLASQKGSSGSALERYSTASALYQGHAPNEIVGRTESEHHAPAPRDLHTYRMPVSQA